MWQRAFAPYHWQVIGPINGHDASALDAAIAEAKADHSRPSLDICRTHIGFGSPRPTPPPATARPSGTRALPPPARPLAGPKLPSVCRRSCTTPWDAREKGKAAEAAWEHTFAAYAKANPELAAEFTRRMRGDLPADWAGIAQIWWRRP